MPGAGPDTRPRPRDLRSEAIALGWVVLAETPGREIVFGAVTKPWEAEVTFRSIPPGRFAAFAEPGYVKIAWSLRAEPGAAGGSVFATETRAVATDRSARRRFRRYWSLVSPGIILIRWAALRPVKLEVERQTRRPAATGTRGRRIIGP